MEQDSILTYSLEGAESIAEAVYTALGSASVCWDSVPHGTFDAERATEIAQGLLHWILMRYERSANGS